MNMRRKPSSQGGGHSNNNNNQNRSRHHRPSNNGGGGGGGNNFNRPRKNYPQLREKYMNQAREMLSQGDRVMAEYYYQHADHCYRMMVEEGILNPRAPQQNKQNDSSQPQENHESGEAQTQNEQNSADNGNGNMNHIDDNVPENTSALPAFLTMGFPNAAANAAPAPAQSWEERDAN